MIVILYDDYITMIKLLTAVLRRFLYYQSHGFHAPAVFCASRDNVNTRCVYVAVAKNVGKFGDVFLNAVKHTGEQVPKVVRENLVRIDISFLAK